MPDATPLRSQDLADQMAAMEWASSWTGLNRSSYEKQGQKIYSKQPIFNTGIRVFADACSLASVKIPLTPPYLPPFSDHCIRWLPCLFPVSQDWTPSSVSTWALWQRRVFHRAILRRLEYSGSTDRIFTALLRLKVRVLHELLNRRGVTSKQRVTIEKLSFPCPFCPNFWERQIVQIQ